MIPRYDTSGIAGLLPHYPLEMAQVFWVVAPCSWVSAFRRNISPSSSGLLASESIHNLEDKGGTFFGKVEKQLPKHTAQQDRRPDSSTNTRWKSEIAVFILLRIYSFLTILVLSLRLVYA